MNITFHEVNETCIDEVIPLVACLPHNCFSTEALRFRLSRMLSYSVYRCWSIRIGNQSIGVFGIWNIGETQSLDHFYILEPYSEEINSQKILQWFTEYTVSNRELSIDI